MKKHKPQKEKVAVRPMTKEELKEKRAIKQFAKRCCKGFAKLDRFHNWSD